jgi:hypothetical protein
MAASRARKIARLVAKDDVSQSHVLFFEFIP